MSKKKGLSVDEKRTRLLEYFHEKKDFFLLKELERDVPKAKGIVQQSIKDVLMSLVHDNLVDTDKIGTSCYFWSFPSKSKQSKKRLLDDLRNQLEEANKKLKVSREKVIAARVGREDTERRLQLLQRLHTLRNEEEKLATEIQKFKDSDPEALEKMKREIEAAKEAANRWTDNVSSIKSWCKNKFGFEEDVLDKNFEIPSNFDYVE